MALSRSSGSSEEVRNRFQGPLSQYWLRLLPLMASQLLRSVDELDGDGTGTERGAVGWICCSQPSLDKLCYEREINITNMFYRRGLTCRPCIYLKGASLFEDFQNLQLSDPFLAPEIEILKRSRKTPGPFCVRLSKPV